MEQSSLMQFKDSLLDYLHEEKRLAEEEIQQRQSCSREEKIQLGLIIPDCHIVHRIGLEYELKTVYVKCSCQPLKENRSVLERGETDWQSIEIYLPHF